MDHFKLIEPYAPPCALCPLLPRFSLARLCLQFCANQATAKQQFATFSFRLNF